MLVSKFTTPMGFEMGVMVWVSLKPSSNAPHNKRFKDSSKLERKFTKNSEGLGNKNLNGKRKSGKDLESTRYVVNDRSMNANTYIYIFMNVMKHKKSMFSMQHCTID